MPSTRTHNLTYDPAEGSGTYLSTKPRFDIPTTLLGATVECIPTTASVDGYIKLQGRLGTEAAPRGWYDSIVTLTCVSGSCADPLQPPYVLAPTNDQGKYELVKTGPGTGVVLGTYSAYGDGAPWLPGSDQGRRRHHRGRVEHHQHLSWAPTLLGGDWTGIVGKVDLGDLTGMGGSFGTQVTGDTGPDINGDTWVNIFDLTLAGGNYEKTSSNWP